jgi:hypothetical protein
MLGYVAQQELDGNSLFEMKVICRDDDAHAPLPDEGVDSILSGHHLANFDGAVLQHRVRIA